MQWRKLGQLFKPQSIHPKLHSHAANPLAVHLKGDLYRIFYDGRDVQNRSSVGFVDMDIPDGRVRYIHDQPIFEHGAETSFYSHGVSIGNCYEVKGQRYILFMGWQFPERGRWRGTIGRLRLHDDLSLELDRDEPFMDLNATDPVSLSYPWVLQERDRYRMWYGSTITWDAGNGEMLHVINGAVSVDGHEWNRLGQTVPYVIGVAQVFSRPTVVSDSDGYHMWFSCRCGRSGKKYKIGYAYSTGGDTWELRLRDAGIDVSVSGWDSEMIEYPFVFDHRDRRYMLYNGNGYGRTGFGLAVLEA
jgi:hypothetical protein